MKYFLSRSFVLCAVLAMFLLSCDKKPQGNFLVSVTYKNAQSIAGGTKVNPHILLEQIPFGSDARPILMDSSRLHDKEGKLELKGSGKEEGLYQLVVEDGPALLLVNDGNSIAVDIDFSKKDDYYTVSGSTSSEAIRKFILGYSDKTELVNLTMANLDSLKRMNSSDSVLLAATDVKNKALNGLNDFLRQALAQAQDPAYTVFVLGMGSRSLPTDEFGGALDAAAKKFPTYRVLAQLKSSYDMQKASEQEIWVGKEVPDMALPGTDGNKVAISSFRGKYLLIDFWASWCSPCRQENPNVVKAYQTFKDHNFTILGVSLDKDRQSWMKAIKDDGLTWTHVSDLAYWDSKAVALFKFNGIPFNLLVDPQGRVIGENLRGSELEAKLQSVLK